MFKGCSCKLLDDTGYTYQIRLNYFITNPLNLLYIYVCIHKICIWASLMTQTAKNLPAMQETQVHSLDQEEPLEKGVATNSSILVENSKDRGAWWAIVHEIAKS